ncbi:phospholipase D family protein [Acinetobacter apis]|uniref:PLD-like domain-containing protein n=1 Tax=Acinetobacter apis TaxID=1229165 RepID=A0A217EI87_9GAMM|nr:phospholipase D-like domain-containing protein [Acinetobacter apis]SNQ29906.1 PLD-like domain-containing protein [Acinetobacter apis]
MRIFQRINNKLNWSKRRYLALILGMILIGDVSLSVYQTVKPLPEGVDFTGKLHHAEVDFIADQTFTDAQGKKQYQQHIFDTMLSMVAEAKSTIVLDMFLFNDQLGKTAAPHRALAQEMVAALIEKKRRHPDMSITVITDPINSYYGSIVPEQDVLLRRVGVEVIETDLIPLRASNPIWTGFWSLCCQNFGNSPGQGWLPNPLGPDKLTLRSYLSLLNFKANHRKTLVVDGASGWEALVTSQNIHAASSAHDNVALRVKGPAAVDVLNTEQSIAKMSGGELPYVLIADHSSNPTLPQVQVLTEKAIERGVLSLIRSANANDHIQMLMFYLSDRDVIEALKEAQLRGVKMSILLDPNQDAFGRTKNGIPNRQVAKELHDAGMTVRWCNTTGEQCHSKMVIRQSGATQELILGSANLTARNLNNYNLETNLRVIGPANAKVFVDAEQYFNTTWSNPNGEQHSLPYEKYADASSLKYMVYRIMEWSGLSTF